MILPGDKFPECSHISTSSD